MLGVDCIYAETITKEKPVRFVANTRTKPDRFLPRGHGNVTINNLDRNVKYSHLLLIILRQMHVLILKAVFLHKIIYNEGFYT